MRDRALSMDTLNFSDDDSEGIEAEFVDDLEGMGGLGDFGFVSQYVLALHWCYIGVASVLYIAARGCACTSMTYCQWARVHAVYVGGACVAYC